MWVVIYRILSKYKVYEVCPDFGSAYNKMHEAIDKMPHIDDFAIITRKEWDRYIETGEQQFFVESAG